MKFFKATPCHITNSNLTTITITVTPKFKLQDGINEIIANKTAGNIKWKKLRFCLLSSALIFFSTILNVL